ncbi:glycosyltransferase family 2 protein [Cohnella terricola]|uniref:Glycosyltransferase family 2 protein n=1 Tax=Cohnella terricola TaxID=1289167 RepID=A0A559JXA0_9BACL|nr:glycosyltransferase [Cohnella terricola]TVY04511.1 glycosyltransferase family 2 protein [Cohnella terricola]
MFKKKKKRIEEVLTVRKEDRRRLSNVPDPENIRVMHDRRGTKTDSAGNGNPATDELEKLRLLSLRYVAEFEVTVVPSRKGEKQYVKGRSVDISSTGILVSFESSSADFKVGGTAKLRFRIPPGAMPEGFELGVSTQATAIRVFTREQDGVEQTMVAFEFVKPLTEYFQRKRWGYSVYMASGLLFVATVFVMLMRAESVIYFKYNVWLYLYSMIAAAFLLSRYLFGAFYRDVPVSPDYTPGVSIIIPCFNEEEWIHRTILSCVNQDYPPDKLEVIVVDDRSTDRSVERIREVIEMIQSESERFGTKERVKMHVLPQNGGKRVALVEGVKMAKHDLVVFVDSDSFLEPNVIRHLVQPFQDPKMGGVAGRTDVENKFTNSITKLQTVRYYIAFRIMKAAESWFDSVTCLSGPLSCYRKELVLKHSDAWLTQKFLGQPATFGDDRSMTNFILRTHRTAYQDKAICSTIVPSDMGVFLKQQMRWKRSWLRESLRASTFMWRKEPFMALFFLIGLVVPIAAPVIVVYNLIYVPIFHHVFPGTFLVGLLMMAMLMSLAHLFFRKSRLWLFGLVFCVFYEFVLLWQMPVAWVTFWKSTWGTRDTPQDIEARNKKAARKQKNKKETEMPL